MNNFKALAKVQLFSMFKLNKILKASPNRKRLGVGALVGLGLLLGAFIVGLGYAYANVFAMSLALTIDLLIPQMFSFTAMACIVFSFYSTGNALYGTKDYDLLSSLPIKRSTIVISKLSFSYLIEVLLSLLILIPTVFVYAQFGGVVTLSKMVRLFVMTLFLPIAPMAISIVLSSLFLIVSSRFKHTGIVQTILYVLAFLAYIVLYLIANEDNLNGMMSLYFFNILVTQGFLEWQSALLFFAINVGILIVSLTLAILTFDKINTIIKAKKTSSNYKLRTYRTNSLTKALLKKEFKLLFHYPIYAMNTLMGPIFTVIGSVMLVVLASLDSTLKALTIFILPPIYVFTLMLAPTSACSVSMEGNSFWLLKTSPLSGKNILKSKYLLNAIFNVIPALISSIVVGIVTQARIEYALMCVIIATFTGVLSGNVGMIFNLLFPLMKWDSPNKPAKQSASILFSMISSMVLTALIAIIIFAWQYNDLLVKYIIITAIIVVLTIVTSILLMAKAEKWLNKKVQL